MEKTIEQERDDLLRGMKIEEKNPDKKEGYIDGVLDMYNAAKRIYCKTTE